MTDIRRQTENDEISSGVRLEALLVGDRDLGWLSRVTGIPRTTLGDYVRNGVKDAGRAVKIAGAFEVSVEWLLTGRSGWREGPILTEGAGAAIAAEQVGLTMIPETDITYSMGGGSIVDDYVEARMVPFRRDWLSRLTRGQPADVFLTRGQGDSMMPTILDDDDVLVNRADRVLRQQDRIWALGYGDLGMIKRVRRLPSGLFQLNSDNPAVTPIEATEDEVYIVGRVIWTGRRV